MERDAISDWSGNFKRFVTFIFALSICFILIDMSQQNFKKGRKIRINLENLKVIFKSYDEEYDKVFLRKNYLIFFFFWKTLYIKDKLGHSPSDFVAPVN